MISAATPKVLLVDRAGACDVSFPFCTAISHFRRDGRVSRKKRARVPVLRQYRPRKPLRKGGQRHASDSDTYLIFLIYFAVNGDRAPVLPGPTIAAASSGVILGLLIMGTIPQAPAPP
jgi:hypothetical protein